MLLHAAITIPGGGSGELVSQDRLFDLSLLNANLLEFNPAALDDYLTDTARAFAAERWWFSAGLPARTR